MSLITPGLALSQDSTLGILLLKSPNYSQLDLFDVADKVRQEAEGSGLASTASSIWASCVDLDCAYDIPERANFDKMIIVDLSRMKKTGTDSAGVSAMSGRMNLYILDREGSSPEKKIKRWYNGTADDIPDLLKVMTWNLLDEQPPEGHFTEEVLALDQGGVGAQLKAWMAAQSAVGDSLGSTEDAVAIETEQDIPDSLKQVSEPRTEVTSADEADIPDSLQGLSEAELAQVLESSSIDAEAVAGGEVDLPDSLKGLTEAELAQVLEGRESESETVPDEEVEIPTSVQGLSEKELALVLEKRKTEGEVIEEGKEIPASAQELSEAELALVLEKRKTETDEEVEEEEEDEAILLMEQDKVSPRALAWMIAKGGIIGKVGTWIAENTALALGCGGVALVGGGYALAVVLSEPDGYGYPPPFPKVP